MPSAPPEGQTMPSAPPLENESATGTDDTLSVALPPEIPEENVANAFAALKVTKEPVPEKRLPTSYYPRWVNDLPLSLLARA